MVSQFSRLSFLFTLFLQIRFSFSFILDSPSSLGTKNNFYSRLHKTNVKNSPLILKSTTEDKDAKKNDVSPPPFAGPILTGEKKNKKSTKSSKRSSDNSPPPFLTQGQESSKKTSKVKNNADYKPPKFKYDPNEFEDLFKDPYGNKDVEGDLTTGNGGVMKSIVSSGTGNRVQDGAEVTVNYIGRIVNHPEKLVFAKGDNYNFIQKDGTMISGWEIAIGTMRVGEKAKVVCSPKYAYGRDGIPPVISATDTLEFEIEVVQSVGNFLTPKNAAELDPLKRRTPKDIAKDFADRTKATELANADKSQFELAKEWFDKLYFFGFFEGVTGENVPIYLQPLVTFPIIFGICGVAFYILYTGGGISLERDAPTQEELDAISGVAYTFTNSFKQMS